MATYPQTNNLNMETKIVPRIPEPKLKKTSKELFSPRQYPARTSFHPKPPQKAEPNIASPNESIALRSIFPKGISYKISLKINIFDNTKLSFL